MDILRACSLNPQIHTVLIGDARPSTPAPASTVVPVGSPLDKFPLQPVVSPIAHLIGGGLTGRRLVRFMRAAPPASDRVIHLNEEVSASYFVHARRDRSPVVFTYHNPPPELSSAPLEMPEEIVRAIGGVIVARFIARHVDRVLVSSHHLREQLIAGGNIPPDKVVWIPLPVDTSFFSPPLPVGERSTAPRRVLYVGRLDSRKGVLSLVRAMSVVDEDVSLTLAGHGPLYFELGRLVRRLGLESRVRLRTRMTSNELLEEYRTSTAFVFPSSLETFGRVVAEAAACGLPTVLPAVPLYSDFHAGGFTVPYQPGVPGALAGAINRVTSDPSLRERLGLRARTYALENCSYEVFTRRLFEVYSSLISGPTAPSSDGPL
jgi:glycosyltransferase involved in cell wall biosynthesis